MIEAQSGERLRGEAKQGFAGKVAGLFHRNPPIWEVVKAIEKQNAAEAEEQRRQTAAEKRLKQVKEPVVDALNSSGLDFSRSFAAAFRPDGPYVKFPGSDTVIWTSYIDLVFDKESGQLQVNGQTHGTQANHMASRGRQFYLDCNKANAHTLTLAFNPDCTIEDAGLPINYGEEAIAQTWPGRNDLSGSKSLQEKFLMRGYENSGAYIQSFSTFAKTGAEGLTIAYSDGAPPELPSVERYTFAEEWGTAL